MMSKRIILRIIAVMGLMAVTLLVFRQFLPEGQPLPPISQMDPEQDFRQYDFVTTIFNTDCKLTLFGTRAQVHPAYQKTSEKLFLLHNTLNRFDEKSELSRFNALPANTPFVCSELLWRAFMTACEAYDETAGAFDVTIGPLMSFWREVANHPQMTEEGIQSRLAEVRKCVGFNLLSFDPDNHAIIKTVDGIQADFGGLAKGLALDIALEILHDNGIQKCYLDFGGNIYQDFPDDHPYKGLCAIADLRHPEEKSERITLGHMDRRFIGTSANALRPISSDAKRPIGHILDTETGIPVECPFVSVSAIADKGWRSDAFSTAVFAKGVILAEQLRQNNPDLAFALLPPGGDPQLLGEL